MKQAKIEIKEEKSIDETQVKTILTVKEKIDLMMAKYADKIDEELSVSLRKAIYGLIQRVQHPEQFCPECDERMFFDPAEGIFNCEECGHKSEKITQVTTVVKNVQVNTPPVNTLRGIPGTVPPQVEKIIAEADKSMKEANGPIHATGALGAKIRQLVNQRDSGGAGPTKEEEDQVKRDPNVVGKINWV